MLEFRILGRLEARRDKREFPLGGRIQRATIGQLLLNANHIVSIDRLADDLYSGSPPVTAVAQVQRAISQLRKTLAPDALIETVAPGYLIRLDSGQLDLMRFEQLCGEARDALRRSDRDSAVALLRRALSLWRGPPLQDFALEAFAQASIRRLEEIRLAALEQCIELEIELGREAEVIPELTELVSGNPLRERTQRLLMLALYRAGRQGEALASYRSAHAALADELGVEPGPALRELQRAILAHDPALLPEGKLSRVHSGPGPAVLFVLREESELEMLASIGAPLLRQRGYELIVARLLPGREEVGNAFISLRERCQLLDLQARVAVFTSAQPARDLARLVVAHEVDLVLLGPASLTDAAIRPGLARILEESPADVAVLRGPVAALDAARPISVLFGGSEHDWAALGLGACLAAGIGSPLRLLGTSRMREGGDGDASRLLADASLAVQQVVGIDAQPSLVQPSSSELLTALESGTVVVVGLPSAWKRSGIGSAATALLDAALPLLLVHHGPRPGVLAPPESRTHFSWSLGP